MITSIEPNLFYQKLSNATHFKKTILDTQLKIYKTEYQVINRYMEMIDIDLDSTVRLLNMETSMRVVCACIWSVRGMMLNY